MPNSSDIASILPTSTTLAKALVDCCAYSNVTQLQGSRVYIVDGTFEPDSVRSALEEELYESGTSGGYEIWENRALTRELYAP